MADIQSPEIEPPHCLVPRIPKSQVWLAPDYVLSTPWRIRRASHPDTSRESLGFHIGAVQLCAAVGTEGERYGLSELGLFRRVTLDRGDQSRFD